MWLPSTFVIILCIKMCIMVNGQSWENKSKESGLNCNASGICREECKWHLPPINLKCPQCSSLGCGSVLNAKSVHCSCDASCLIHKDCCQDFQSNCPLQYNLARKALGKHNLLIKPTCILVKTISEFSRFQIVDSCNTKKCQLDDSISNLNQYPFPVTDNDTGVHYISHECAQCNNISNIVGWSSELKCIINQRKENISSQDIGSWLAIKKCKMRLKRPVGLRLCLANLVKECSTCSNVALKNACKSQTTDYVSRGSIVFHNQYCAVCHLTNSKHICGVSDEINVSPPFNDKPYPGPSLYILFNFKGEGNHYVNIVKTKFECYRPYVMIGNQCLGPFCNFGILLGQEDCFYQSSEDITFNISFKVTTNQTSISMSEQYFVQAFSNELNLYFNDISLNNSVEGEHRFIITFDCSNTSNNLSYRKGEAIDYYHWKCFITYVHGISFSWTDAVNFQASEVISNENIFKTTLLIYIHQSVQNYIVPKNVKIVELEMMSPFKLFRNHEGETKIIKGSADYNESNGNDYVNFSYHNTTCINVLYSKNEYKYKDNSLIISELKKHVPSDMFKIQNETAFVCKEFYEKYLVKVNWLYHKSLPLLIINNVALGLSILSLITRCFLQAFVPLYWTFPNKLQFVLCLSICATYLLAFFVPMVALQPKICYSFALLLHWGFLATFSCKLCVAVDMFKKFRPSYVQSSSEHGKQLLYNSLLCWGCPLIFVGITCGLDYTNINSFFKPEYSNSRCWMTNQFAHIVYFGIPLGCLLLAILSTFVFTSINLRKMIKTSSAVKRRSSSYEFKVNVKLACLLGITWITAFLASAINQPVVWYIFIVLCGSQGVFIAFCFVCTRPVLNSLSKHISDQETTSENS